MVKLNWLFARPRPNRQKQLVVSSCFRPHYVGQDPGASWRRQSCVRFPEPGRADRIVRATTLRCQMSTFIQPSPLV